MNVEPRDDEFIRVPLPKKEDNEMFGITEQLLGSSRIRVICADNKHRMGRIPGKMKKRMWIRDGDLVIIKPWSFQDDKADVMYRYTKTEAAYLSKKHLLPPMLDLFQDVSFTRDYSKR
ncbi:MAG: translation initiation factor eIF-1A [Candidatus Thermoplasmatota archaeon]|nr:translation initiation factor eIF-1A [Candidatus Thermoplasmatota archaeon]